MSLKRFLGTGALLGLALIALLAVPNAPLATAAGTSPEGAANTTVIEACSCPMFCQCYFNSEPAGGMSHEGHAMEHYCRVLPESPDAAAEAVKEARAFRQTLGFSV